MSLAFSACRHLFFLIINFSIFLLFLHMHIQSRCFVKYSSYLVFNLR